MDLKQFLEKQSVKEVTCGECQNVLTGNIVSVYDLGLFFWERGGKQFVQYQKEIGDVADELSDYVTYAEDSIEPNYPFEDVALQARDFLDALACLGEEKVKELIKELGA